VSDRVWGSWFRRLRLSTAKENLLAGDGRMAPATRMTDRPLPQSTLKQQREQTIALLCEHFAQDRLEVEEFESRLDRAHRATTAVELEALLHDLPAPVPPVPAPARDALARGTRAVADAVRDSRTLLAFMGGVERRGRWTPARRNVVISIMGGAALDFREVVLPPGQTEVFIFCLMGGTEIIVPPTLAVDASGVAIMGGFEHASSPPPADPDAPVLRINGLCVMGGVEILCRYPGESAKDARERQREERRVLRQERRRLRDG
jgi:hypothetical protein